MTSINFIDEEECPKHSDSLNIPDFRDIYHGCMSREVSVKTLKASSVNNCYLVRKRINADEDEHCVEYILSFLNGDEDYHFKIKKENKYFIFANRYFPSFKCVISHYMLSNIINDAHLEFGVVNKTITAIRESLRGLSCYLVDNISNERIIELLHKCGPGSYLFRPRTDDNNQFVLMFFDGAKIHKLKMDVQVLEKKSINGKEVTEPVVVIVLGRNFFETWREMVDNFTVNPIVKVDGPNCQDKLVTAVDVNGNSSEGDIYRKIKFSRALPQRDIFSVHGEINTLEGSKKKWKQCNGSVDKEHGHLIIKNSKGSTQLVELIRYNFIPIDYSVHQRYCFLLHNKDNNGVPKTYYISILDPSIAGCNSNAYDHREMSEEAYAYRPYNLVEYDKEVYHSTESSADKDGDSLLRRAYDRWTVAVKRHCSNTKDDVANEENPERHSKLHRYNRRLKLTIGHTGGQEISLVDSDATVSPSLNYSLSTSQSSQSIPSYGQFEVMLGKYLIAVIPRIKDGGTQTLIFQDLPSNLNDVSVNIRIKGSKRKEFTKELCNFTRVHQELVPRSVACTQPFQSIEPDPISSQGYSCNLGPPSIQADPPSSCGPVTVDCYASIEYKELIILPFNNYTALSRHIMDNLITIFSNENFSKSFKHALELNEYKKLLNCFLYMAIWEKRQVDFLYLFFLEDLKDSTASLYFRNNSCASRLFLDYVFQFASDWLVCSYVGFFEELFKSTDLITSSEPTTYDNGSPETPEQTSTAIESDVLLKCLTAALDGINENLKQCPLTLRQLFHNIQCEIEHLHPNFIEHRSDKPTDSCDTQGLRYKLLTNLVLFRFFCAVMNSRGERQDDFLRKISESIRKKNDSNFSSFPKTFARQEPLNDFMTKISRLIFQTYSSNKNNKDKIDFIKYIEDYRERTIESLNHELTRSLTSKEKEAMALQLDSESETICRLSSLSRRFNEVLEFLSKLQEDPSYFLKLKPDMESVPSEFTKYHVISQDLNTIIDEINTKKSCNNNLTLIERL